MKNIIFVRKDGRVCVTGLSYDSRLANSVTTPEGTVLINVQLVKKKKNFVPTPVSMLCNRWKREGHKIEWAETEDAFVERMKVRTLAQPSNIGATKVEVVDNYDIPDKEDRKNRNKWKLNKGKIEGV